MGNSNGLFATGHVEGVKYEGRHVRHQEPKDIYNRLLGMLTAFPLITTLSEEWPRISTLL